MPFKILRFLVFIESRDVIYTRTTIRDQPWWSWVFPRYKVWGLSFSNPYRMFSYHLWLSWSILEKIWYIPKIHRMPYWHIWGCRNGLDGRMITIEGAFESSDIILVDQKKFGNARTHPEEVRVVKSKKCSQIHTISRKFYFSLRVVLRDEFLYCRIFSHQQEWCLSSQTHLQSRSFEHSIHLYNLIYANKTFRGFLVYLKFSPKWIKTTRDGIRTSIRYGFQKLKPHTSRLWNT